MRKGMMVMLVVLLMVMIFREAGKETAPIDIVESPPDPKERAINVCRGAIEGISKNPSSVDHHSFTSPPNVRVMNSGLIEVFSKFSAANAYGARSTFIARCVVSADGSTFSEITTQVSR